MISSKKLLPVLASGGGAALYVEDVFSTYLYTGNGSTQSIVNGIDLATEGGMVWIKGRSAVSNNAISDTDRGGNNFLATNKTDAEDVGAGITFNTDGYTLGNGSLNWNANSDTFASWTFRKAPGFHDVVTWTGAAGSGLRNINHNLGSAPAFIIARRTDLGGQWFCWHKGLTSTNYYLFLNDTGAEANSGAVVWDSTATTFAVHSGVVGDVSGASYIAYLFADDAQIFGENGDESIIKCGSYTGNGSATNGPLINLGWELQYLLIKQSTGTGGWHLLDTMRGIITGAGDALLTPTSAGAESSTTEMVRVDALGFVPEANWSSINASGQTYIYMAIRRPMKVPTSGTEVFAIDTRATTGEPTYTSNFPVDLGFRFVPNAVSYKNIHSRLTGSGVMYTDATDAESSDANCTFDYMNGFRNDSGTNYSGFALMFRRAPKFYDTVCYTGDGIAGRTVAHGLKVAPEMMIVKTRGQSGNWNTYHSALGNTKFVNLNESGPFQTSSGTWNNTTPTDSVFTLGVSITNYSTIPYIALLFATLAGVSKVGSYTGNGTSQTLDMGFSSGARFFLVKASSTTGSWWLYDSVRGVVAGADPALQLNSTAAEVTTADACDPDSSGIIVNEEATCSINASGVSYVYLGIS